MKKRILSVSLVVLSALTVLMAAKCGKKGYVTEPIPGTREELPLVQVDGKAVPTIIVSTQLGQTTVVGGKATLGEAIATGKYDLILQHKSELTDKLTTVIGTVLFTRTDRTVSATIDLGVGLGAHAFTFQLN